MIFFFYIGGLATGVCFFYYLPGIESGEIGEHGSFLANVYEFSNR